jgi:hypothetical protein
MIPTLGVRPLRGFREKLSRWGLILLVHRDASPDGRLRHDVPVICPGVLLG